MVVSIHASRGEATGLAMLIAPGTLEPASRQNTLEEQDLLIHDLAELFE